MSTGTLNKLGGGIFLILVLLLYSRSLSSPMVYDSQAYIVENGFIKDPANLPLLLTSEYFSGTQKPRYRPVSALGYFVGYQAFGLIPLWWRLSKLMLHVLNALLLVRLSKKIVSVPHVPWLSGFLFLLSPLAVEPLVCVAFNDDLLCFLFLFSAFNLVITPLKKSRSVPRLILASLCYALALFCKESALLGLPFLMVLTCFKPHFKKLSWAWWVSWGGITLVYLYFRLGPMSGPDLMGITPSWDWSRLSLISRVFLKNTLLIFIPINLCLDYVLPLPGLAWNIPGSLALFGVLFVVGLLGLGFKSSNYKIPVSWLILSLLPTLHIFPLPRLMADRYLYFSLVGWAWIISISWGKIRPRAPGKILVLIVILICLASLTGFRNELWAGKGKIWNDVIKKSPHSTAGYFNLAGIKVDEKKLREAELLYREGLKVIRDRASALTGLLGLAEIYRQKGKKELALAIMDQVLPWDPDSERTLLMLAYIRLEARELSLAKDMLLRILELYPYNYEATSLLGAVMAEEGDWETGQFLMEKAMRMNPDYIQGQQNLDTLHRIKP